MNTGNRTNVRTTIPNPSDDVDYLVERRCRCGKQKRRRAPTRVEIANLAKPLDRRFHSVASNRTVYMDIDETRRKIISVNIDDLVFAAGGPLANRGDFSLLDDEFETIANFVGKNQAGVAEDHLGGAYNPAGAVVLAEFAPAGISFSVVALRPSAFRQGCFNRRGLFRPFVM